MLEGSDDWIVRRDGISRPLIDGNVSSPAATSALREFGTVNLLLHKPDCSWMSIKMRGAPEIRV
jgi:hypothetical protein